MWTRSIRSVRYREGIKKKHLDSLAIEKSLDLFVNDVLFKSFVMSPGNEVSLIIGYLLINGYDLSLEQANQFFLKGNKVVFNGTLNLKKIDKEVPSSFNSTFNYLDIIHLMAFFQEKAFLFKDTAVSHSAALALNNEIIFFAEDIVYFNALCKIIGLAFLDEKLVQDYSLIVSDIISLDVIKLAKQFLFSCIISRVGVSSRAYDIAFQKRISLLGFARNKSFNVYTSFTTIIV